MQIIAMYRTSKVARKFSKLNENVKLAFAEQFPDHKKHNETKDDPNQPVKLQFDVIDNPLVHL